MSALHFKGFYLEVCLVGRLFVSSFMSTCVYYGVLYLTVIKATTIHATEVLKTRSFDSFLVWERIILDHTLLRAVRISRNFSILEGVFFKDKVLY